MNELSIELSGLLGTAALLLAYGLVSTRRLAGDSPVYQGLNLLGGVLVLVTFGHLLKEPLFAFHSHVIPRLALLLFILMLPRGDDRFSLDALLAGQK